MTKEEFLLLNGFLLKDEDLDNEDIEYLIKATELLMPYVFKHEGNTRETAIPINCVHNEYVALRLTYLIYKRIRQELYEDKETNKYYDILTIKIIENKEIKVWFDINSFYPSFYQEYLDKNSNL